jgi:hypothetical protein
MAFMIVSPVWLVASAISRLSRFSAHLKVCAKTVPKRSLGAFLNNIDEIARIFSRGQ